MCPMVWNTDDKPMQPLNRQWSEQMRKETMADPMLPPNTNFCQCGGCKEYFYSVLAFEKHRVGPYTDRSCSSHAQMAELKLSLDRGYWRLPKRIGEYSK